MAFRYKLTIEYNGTPYAGWQRQPDMLSVQEAIEVAVEKFSGEQVKVFCAGRTDAGVHAIAQIGHIDLGKEHDPFSVMQGINFYLFEDPANRVAIIDAEFVDDSFHARFSAIRRHYFYRITNRRARLGLELGRAWNVVEELDEHAMQKAADLLLGTHDFNSFRDTKCQAKSPIKTLEMLDVKRHGNEIHVTTHAQSFLHHQVRIMVGSLALVGKGRWTLDDMQAALDARDRTAAGPTAPPDGLYLVRVDY